MVDAREKSIEEISIMQLPQFRRQLRHNRPENLRYLILQPFVGSVVQHNVTDRRSGHRRIHPIRQILKPHPGIPDQGINHFFIDSSFDFLHIDLWLIARN